MAYVRRAWAAVTKQPIRAGLTAVIVVGALLVLAAARGSVAPPRPSLQFLVGQNSVRTVRDRRDMWVTLSQDFYSFRGDFSSVYEAARAELSALGYTETKRAPGDEDAYGTRQFLLRTSRWNGYITIRIMNNVKFVAASTPPHSQYTTADRYTQKFEAGWVSVEVCQNCPRSALSRRVAWTVYRLRSKLGL